MLDHIGLDPVHHRREHIEPLPLVLHQRVFLAVTAEADALLQVIHGQEVILPVRINHPEHDHLLELTHERLAEFLLLFLIGILYTGEDLFANGFAAEVLKVNGAVKMERELTVDRIGQALEVPPLFIHLFLTVEVQNPVQPFLDHFKDGIGDNLTLQDPAPLLIDHGALFVHDIVIFQELLPDVEVVALNLLLGVFNGPRDHSVFDRNPLFHPQPLHEAGDAIGTEDPHEVVLQR